MEARGISENKLSKLSSVSQSTLNSLYAKNNMPSIPTLEDLCEGLGMSMSEFFSIREHEIRVEESENNMYQVKSNNNELRIQNLIEKFMLLSEKDKKNIEGILDSLTKLK